MARVLCISDGLVSVVLPALEVGRRLAEDGHHVGFLAAARYAESARRLGLRFTELPAAVCAPRRRSQEIGRWPIGDELAERVLDFAPDLLLIDGELHEVIVVALGLQQRHGLRVVLLNSFVSIWRSPGVPPPHVLAQPGLGWRGSRLVVAAYWEALFCRKRWRRFRGRALQGTTDRVTRLRRLAARHGVELKAVVDTRQWSIPFTYRNLPVLSLHAREFEFPHRLDVRAHYVGPMVLASDHRPAPDQPDTGREVRRLEALLEALPPSETLVLAVFGSAATVGDQLPRRLVDACQVEGWTLVLGLGARGLDQLGALPANVHAFPWIPQLDVLARADVLVTHGGINSLDESILAGVPVLIYCGHATDMAGNTSRVLWHGLGAMGSPRDTAGGIRERLQGLLADRDCQQRVRTMARVYQEYATSRRLEETVRHLLEEDGGELADTASGQRR